GGEAVTAAPVELLDGADEAELPLLHQVVHVEALAHEAPGVGHHQAEVVGDELVLSSGSRVHAANEAAARAVVTAAGASVAGAPGEDRPLEADVGQLCRHAFPPAPATPGRRLVACG